MMAQIPRQGGLKLKPEGHMWPAIAISVARSRIIIHQGRRPHRLKFNDSSVHK